MELLLEPFAYGYMRNAMWVSALVGGVCAFLSAYLMLKGWSLIGDALSHSIVPGVAGAYMLGLPFSIGASSERCRRRMLVLNRAARGRRHRPGVTTLFALGLLMASIRRPRSASRPSCSATSLAFLG
jgi:manganese/iron transport system permease protein